MPNSHGLVDKTARFFFVVCASLVVAGGLRIQIPSGFFEIGEINLWAAVGILLFLAIGRTRDTSLSAIFLDALGSLLTTSRPSRLWYFVLYTAIALFFTHFFRFITLNTNQWDMGLVHNTLFYFNTSIALPCDTCRNFTYLGEHLSFTFFMVAPLMSLIKSNLLVFFMQIALPIGALLLFAFYGPLANARNLILLWFSFVFANEGFRSGLLFDFREDILIFIFFLLMAWGIYKGHILAIFFGLAGALLSKENVFSSALMAAGTVCFAKESSLSKRNRALVAFGIVITSSIYAYVSFKYLIPLFHGQSGQEHTALMARFPGLGRTPAELVANFLQSPFSFIYRFSYNSLSGRSFTYLFLIGASGIFWGRKHWPWLLPALPGIAFNLLSAAPSQRSLGYHYDLINVCWIAVAISFGVRASANSPLPTNQKQIRIGIILALLTFGRSPLFYMTQYILDDGKRISSTIKLQQQRFLQPVAGDIFLLTSLVGHHERVRHFDLSSPMPDQSIEQTLSQFFKDTARTNSNSEGRSFHDARTIVLHSAEPGQRWLANLLRKNSLVKSVFSTRTENNPINFWIEAFELPTTLETFWCTNYSVCLPKP